MPGANLLKRKYFNVTKDIVDKNIDFSKQDGYISFGDEVFKALCDKFGFEKELFLMYSKPDKRESRAKFYMLLKCGHRTNISLMAPLKDIKPNTDLKLYFYKGSLCACNEKFDSADIVSDTSDSIMSDLSLEPSQETSTASNLETSHHDDASIAANNGNRNGSNEIPRNTLGGNDSDASLNRSRDGALNEEGDIHASTVNNDAPVAIQNQRPPLNVTQNNPLSSVNENEPLDRSRNGGLNALGNNSRMLRNNNGGNKRANESDDWSVIGPVKVRVLEEQVEINTQEIKELKRLNQFGNSLITGLDQTIGDNNSRRESMQIFQPPMPINRESNSTPMPPRMPINVVIPTLGGTTFDFTHGPTTRGTQVEVLNDQQFTPNDEVQKLREELRLIMEANAREKEENAKKLREMEEENARKLREMEDKVLKISEGQEVVKNGLKVVLIESREAVQLSIQSTEKGNNAANQVEQILENLQPRDMNECD